MKSWIFSHLMLQSCTPYVGVKGLLCCEVTCRTHSTCLFLKKQHKRSRNVWQDECGERRASASVRTQSGPPTTILLHSSSPPHHLTPPCSCYSLSVSLKPWRRVTRNLLTDQSQQTVCWSYDDITIEQEEVVYSRTTELPKGGVLGGDTALL